MSVIPMTDTSSGTAVHHCSSPRSSNRTTLAMIHELQVVFNGVERRMFDIVADEYKLKGGSVSGQVLPTGAPVTNDTSSGIARRDSNRSYASSSVPTFFRGSRFPTNST